MLRSILRSIRRTGRSVKRGGVVMIQVVLMPGFNKGNVFRKLRCIERCPPLRNLREIGVGSPESQCK